MIWPAFKLAESPSSSTTFIPYNLSFSRIKSFVWINWSSKNNVSPGSWTLTLRIIWRITTSKCLSLIFTPCKRYTSWISFTKYCWTAAGPWILKISSGVIAPSDKGTPALTKSFSWTRIWLESFTRYFLTSPNLDSITISRLPLLIFPKETTPSISETTAGFEGLRASNNSVILGRPPVISPDLEERRGIFTKTLPALIFSPFSTIKWAPTGKL